MATQINISVSDGNASKGPTTVGYELAPHDKEAEYRAKVGKIIAPKLEGYRTGLNYVLKCLPDGYHLWQKHRKDTPSAKAHIDRYLYGHPTGYIFRSTNEFAPHALWLAQGREGRCICVACTGKRTAKSLMKPPTPVATSTSKTVKTGSETRDRVMREKVDPKAPSKESVFTKLMTRLRKEADMEVMVNETDNLAFRIEHKNFVKTIPEVAEQGAFIPRTGEIVLFRVPAKPGDIIQDHGLWKAGLITETPHPDTLPIHVSELAETDPQPAKEGLGLNYTGFRVETMTDPNSHRKDEQLQWIYLAISCLRPFSLLPSLLEDVEESKWHKSIHNALKSQAAFSLALPLKFIGKWPDAWIMHGGVYLGAELLVVGDAVVIAPSPPSSSSLQGQGNSAQQPHILVIAAVVLSFHDLRPDPPYHSRVTGDYCSSIDVHLHGRLYSITPSSTAADNAMDTDINLPPAMHDTNGTYNFTLLPSSDNTDIHTFPLTHVIGRLHEATVLPHYHPSSPSPDSQPPISLHPASPSTTSFIHRARAHACTHDERIIALNKRQHTLSTGTHDLDPDGGGNIEIHRDRPERGDSGMGEVQWFWANDRVEALGLHTFGEMDVGKQWEEFVGRERMRYEG